MILDNLTVLYLAAVLLKQFVKKHWQEGEDSFEPPVVSVDEKVNMLSFLFYKYYKKVDIYKQCYQKWHYSIADFGESSIKTATLS
jgi:hypothetical protein